MIPISVGSVPVYSVLVVTVAARTCQFFAVYYTRVYLWKDAVIPSSSCSYRDTEEYTLGLRTWDRSLYLSTPNTLPWHAPFYTNRFSNIFFNQGCSWVAGTCFWGEHQYMCTPNINWRWTPIYLLQKYFWCEHKYISKICCIHRFLSHWSKVFSSAICTWCYSLTFQCRFALQTCCIITTSKLHCLTHYRCLVTQQHLAELNCFWPTTSRDQKRQEQSLSGGVS